MDDILYALRAHVTEDAQQLDVKRAPSETKFTVYQSDGMWNVADIPRWLSQLRYPEDSDRLYRAVCEPELRAALHREIQEGRLLLRSQLTGLPTGKTDAPHNFAVANDEDVAAFAKLCGITILFSDEDEPESTESPKDAAKSVQTKRPGISKQAVIAAFNGLHFDRDGWSRALANLKDHPWLVDCRVEPGRQGSKKSATWNPALIALGLEDKGVDKEKLNAVFFGRLKDWREEWQEACKSFSE